LRQVVDGGASRSYGIDVARLAGLPRTVIGRARQILGRLESDARLAQRNQLSLFVTPAPAPGESGAERREHVADGVIERLRELDPDRMTPIEALTALAELRSALL